MSETVIIKKLDNSFLLIKCNQEISKQLTQRYSFFVPNYRFIPRYKSGIWDGKIRLFDVQTGKLPIGFAKDVYKFIKKITKDIICDFSIFNNNGFNISSDEINNFCQLIKLPFKPYDHQIKAVKIALKEKRIVLESATSSGKSLIIFLLCNFLKMKDENEKILIIVPSIQLVEQMTSDMCEYIENYDKSYEDNIQKIYSGQERFRDDRHIIISTWQSLQNMHKDVFKQYSTVIVDEVHSAGSAKVLQSIINDCVNATTKIGMTGSVSEELTHKKQLNGIFGNITPIIDAKGLIDKGLAAQFDIKCIVLKYNKKRDDELKKILESFPKGSQQREIKKYNAEMKYISENLDEKFKFLNKFLNKIEKNTIVMFKSISYGKKLYKELYKNSGKRVYYIDGTINVDIREEIRYNMEKYNNCLLVGSTGTIKQGINIKNVYNVVLAESFKAPITLIQTIGRILRKLKNKKATLYDFADDLSNNNYGMKHFKSRCRTYKKEKHKYKIVKVKI